MNDVRAHRDDVPIRDLQDDRPADPNAEFVTASRPKARRRWGGRLLALVALLLLAGAIAFGAWRYYQREQQVTATAEQQRGLVPSVRVATVEANPGIVSVSLPGTTAAFATTGIYARASGYIAKRNVDIGDRVKAGDLLAELSVPELDDQISQNEALLNQLNAALEQVQANRDLAQVTWNRDQPLVEKGWLTQQQGTIDSQNLKSQEAAVGVAKANVAAQENQLRVLRQNREYARVVAPFDGVVTQRNVDVGSFVQGNTTSGTFLFEVMQNAIIRVFVFVPQDAAFGVAPGIDASVHVPELPDRDFSGKVTRISDALQSGTRTLLTEIDLPNPDGALPPGVYCVIELKVPRKAPTFLVPAEAIIFNSNGLQVAVVSDGKAEFRKVRETRDYGTRVEVDSGVKAGEQVILNPPVTLVDGGKVQLRTDTPAQKG
ncbi:efflux RND transporter periplasmic adaptor subunit [Pseudaminobacter sp. 19-2017]|uniref:Efflux RND transporter periplasmic adaptor subunit n=1 Tax=Pseudaminobacter soli (ex Zhang et al. 2022) TaxID=2831468 RepID=A0A942E139_9HYPH|nr:efflux RND transporter periplasmic adaptor subunit [Pseudaminobacter soli]MBS3649076.1 efflux RND transporter periplasmic adaptor subunit [Pseudaminobacter soli]